MNLHVQLWQDLIDLCRSINHDQYTYKCEWLSGISIAEHLRHSYEFYVCLLDGSATAQINYENRQRDRKVETNLDYAIAQLELLKGRLQQLKPNALVQLQSKESSQQQVKSSFERELLYCLDHAIHHQALIKIGLKELGLSHLVSPDFGVAYSTLRYRART